MPPEVIRQVVRDGYDGMKNCYEEGLRRDPALKGKIITRFVIGGDGAVSSAADVHDAHEAPPAVRNEPRFPDPKVTECVVSRFAALKFPQPRGGASVTVVYPIVFQPGQ